MRADANKGSPEIIQIQMKEFDLGYNFHILILPVHQLLISLIFIITLF